MEREKRKVGRPISMVREDKVRRNFSLQRKISDAIDEYAIKMNKTSSEVVEDFCSAGILGSDEEIEIDKLKAQKAKLDFEAAKLAIQIKEKEESLRRTQEIQEQILKTNMFIATSFRMLYERIKPSGKFTADMEKIEPYWGITFNVRKLNDHFNEIDSMNDDELISLLELKKVAKNPKMLPEIMKRVGL